jgi:hypothetical protein
VAPPAATGVAHQVTNLAAMVDPDHPPGESDPLEGRDEATPEAELATAKAAPGLG